MYLLRKFINWRGLLLSKSNRNIIFFSQVVSEKLVSFLCSRSMTVMHDEALPALRAPGWLFIAWPEKPSVLLTACSVTNPASCFPLMLFAKHPPIYSSFIDIHSTSDQLYVEDLINTRIGKGLQATSLPSRSLICSLYWLEENLMVEKYRKCIRQGH